MVYIVTKRQEQAMETRTKLVDSAMRLIGSRGYENVTVDDIVEDSGVAKGTFYNYFKKKSDILLELSSSIYDLLQEGMNIDQNAAVLDRLHGFVRYWYRDVNKYNLQLAREAVKLYALSSDMGEPGENVSQMERGIELIRSYIACGVERGQLKADTPIDTLSKALMFSMQGSAVYHCKHESDFDVSDWCEQFIGSVLDPLMKPWLSMNHT